MREHGFDPASGKSLLEEEMPAELREAAQSEEKKEKIAKAVDKINEGQQEEDERDRASQEEMENPDNTVYISADDVGVRHHIFPRALQLILSQKSEKADSPKDRRICFTFHILASMFQKEITYQRQH